MRLLLISCGHLSLAVGLIGAFLPLLPTTPFILLSAFFYSRGSERFHRRLSGHPRFGRMLLDWNQHGVIRPRAKIVSAALILASVSYPVFFRDFHWGLKLAALGCCGCCLGFIFSRPSAPRSEPELTSKTGSSTQRNTA